MCCRWFCCSCSLTALTRSSALSSDKADGLVSFVHDSDAALRMMLRIKMMMIATISMTMMMMAATRIGLFWPTLTLLSFSTKMLVIKIFNDDDNYDGDYQDVDDDDDDSVY